MDINNGCIRYIRVIQVIVVPWLLNGYGFCTIRGLLMYFQGRSPRKYIVNRAMVQLACISNTHCEASANEWAALLLSN